MAANRSVQLAAAADASSQNARKGWIDQFEIESLVRDQVHRQSEKEMCADGRESHDHEVPLSHRFGELMSVVQADDPDAVVRGPSAGALDIQASMRRAEIQKKRDFGRREVPLLNRYAKVARTREVAVDIGAKARISGSLRCLPFAQFGSVFAGFATSKGSRSMIAVNSFLIPSPGRAWTCRRTNSGLQRTTTALHRRGIRRRSLTLTAQRGGCAQVHPDIVETVGEFSEYHRQRRHAQIAAIVAFTLSSIPSSPPSRRPSKNISATA